jgi:hypothetical protein
MNEDVGRTPQLEAPTVALLMRKISARPSWVAEDPYEIDSATFEAGWREMNQIQQRQGRAVPTAPWIAARNFLLRGVPVVTNDAQD